MKTMKKLSILLICTLALLTGVEKACLASFDHRYKQLDMPVGEAHSANAVNSHPDHSEQDVSVIPTVFTFHLTSLVGQRIPVSDNFILQKTNTSIWLPPKLS